MKRIPLELFIWVAGLLYVSLIPPGNISLCLFHQLGFNYCPGCGLGHAIYYLKHGQWQQSFEANPLGLFAIFVLVMRIFKLIHQIQFLQFEAFISRMVQQLKSTL